MTKKEERQLIYQKYNGKCAYCGNVLPDRWHQDHKIPIVRDYEWNKSKTRYVPNGQCEHPELDVFENKVPSCPSCNTIKSSMSIDSFRELIQNFITSLNRDSTQYKMAKKYGLLNETNIRVEFYYEKVERLASESLLRLGGAN